MSSNGTTQNGPDFTIDKDNLYRETSVTDMRIGTVQIFSPVLEDGSDDNSRKRIFLGRTQLNTQQGPIPIQAKIDAATLPEALSLFPKVLKAETQKVMARLQQLQEQQKKAQDSRIIVPGMNN